MLGTGQDRCGGCPLSPVLLASSLLHLRQAEVHTRDSAPQHDAKKAALFPEHPRGPACLLGLRQLPFFPLVYVWVSEGGPCPAAWGREQDLFPP